MSVIYMTTIRNGYTFVEVETTILLFTKYIIPYKVSDYVITNY